MFVHETELIPEITTVLAMLQLVSKHDNSRNHNSTALKASTSSRFYILNKFYDLVSVPSTLRIDQKSW